MSSGKFACILPVDRRLRLALIGGGALCGLAGGLLTVALPLPLPLRAATTLVWTAASVRELALQRRSFRRIDRISITSEGEVDGVALDGSRYALELLSGSLVSPGGAWLRFRFPDGSLACEWLLRRGDQADQWRILQLVWRQRGGCFGRPRRS